MEYFKIWNVENNINHSNIADSCTDCFKNCPSGISIFDHNPCNNKKRKRFFEGTDEEGFYFCTDEIECVGSNKIFRSKVKVLKALLPLLNEYKKNIFQEVNIQNKRIFHNILTLNGHNIQELYAIVSDGVLSHKVDRQRTLVKEALINKADEAASMFLRIAKNNLAIQTNFNVFKKLSEPNPVMNYRKQKIKRVLLTVYHVFFQNFFDRDIKVIIDDNDFEFFIDYESVSVAFYHILDNATKYALRNSTINVKFIEDNDYCKISFEMDSIEIKESEKMRLTEEGFKGEIARQMESQGEGIGMFIISQLVKLNKGIFTVNTSREKKKKVYDGIPYYRNQFVIMLPNYKYAPKKF